LRFIQYYQFSHICEYRPYERGCSRCAASGPIWLWGPWTSKFKIEMGNYT